MKNYKSMLVLLALQVVSLGTNAQQGDLVFTYDAAGNIIERKIQVMANGRMGKFDAPKDSIYPFKVFPNPTNQFLNIDGPLPDGKTSADVSILTINGQLVKKETYNGQAKAIPVSELKPGVYVLEIRYSKHEASTYKIIITN